MSRVIFDNQPAAPQLNPGRADIACFVGLVRVLDGATVPAGQVSWLKSLGYKDAQIAPPTTDKQQLRQQLFLNIPILLENYLAFTSMFDDGSAGNAFGTDYVAAAIRSFFAQGGARCYVVRVGDPVTPADTPQQKAAKLMALLPNTAYAPDTAQSWTGVSSLGALEDVSFLATPDLPILP